MDRQKSILVLVVILSCAGLCFSKYSGGTGEPNDPYLIATAEDMNQIGANPDDWDKHFLLVADINLADYTGTQFNIIGNENAPFTGVFDGNNHTISTFTYECNDTDNIGLFGYICGLNAIIKDLTLTNPDVNATGYSHSVGSLVGCLGYGTINGCGVESGSISGDWSVGGLVGDNDGTISNCYATGNISGEVATGGVVGWNSGTISNCYAAGSISRYYGIGGLVGLNLDTIEDCYAIGTVSGNYDIGGLVGHQGLGGMISNCYATADVDGNDDWAGGLVGRNYHGTISNCYATGVIDGNACAGGLVGQNGNHEHPDEDQTGYIYNCYSTGEVMGSSAVGGLVGLHIEGEIEDSFWDVNTSGQSTSDGGTPKTTVEMQTESTFTDAGWDFIEIWDIGENQTYPFLRVYSAGDINHDDIVNFYDLAILAGRWLEGVGQ